MSKSLTKVRIIGKSCYLFADELKASQFKRDGHNALRLKIRSYKMKATTCPSQRRPFEYVKGLRSDGSRKNEVGRIDIEIGMFRIDQQEAIDKIYPLILKRHKKDMKIGCEKPWNGVIMPFIVQTLYTKNIKTGDVCHWKATTISDSSEPAVMMLVSVNRIGVDKLRENAATMAAGKMMANTCIMCPKLGPLRCIKS